MLPSREAYEAVRAASTDLAVEQYGEVLTPLWLVERMLDALPASVWSEPGYRWLEPACGLAPFLFVVTERLMLSLATAIPNPLERERHIVEKMLVFNEIQPRNVERVAQLFAPYQLVMFAGSYFEAVPPSLRVNVIVGNPPYNLTNNRATGNSLWPRFVEHSLRSELLLPGGYLSFVHPPTWRKPTYDKSQLRGLFAALTHENAMLHLEIAGAAEGKRCFGCLTKYDWYVVKKGAASGQTTVRDELEQRSTLALRDWSWLPNAGFEEVRRLLPRGDEPSQPVLYNCYYHASLGHVSKEPSGEHRRRLVHSTPAIGAVLRYSNLLHSKDVMFGKRKVICGESSSKGAFYDARGEYATTQGAFAFPVDSDEDGEALVAYLRSPAFAAVVKHTTWGNFRLEWRLFASLRQGFWRS